MRTEDGMTETLKMKIQRNESTETGKRIWAAVDRGAEKAPQIVKDRLKMNNELTASELVHEARYWLGEDLPGGTSPSELDPQLAAYYLRQAANKLVPQEDKELLEIQDILLEAIPDDMEIEIPCGDWNTYAHADVLVEEIIGRLLALAQKNENV